MLRERQDCPVLPAARSVVRLTIASLQLQPDRPAARQITVAVELKSRHVVGGAHAAGNRQALPRLHVPDLVDALPVTSLILQVRDGWLSQLSATKLLSPVHPRCHSALSHTTSSIRVSKGESAATTGQIAGVDELDLEIHPLSDGTH